MWQDLLTKPGLMKGAYCALADDFGWVFSKYGAAASNRSHEFGRLNIERPRIGDEYVKAKDNRVKVRLSKGAGV